MKSKNLNFKFLYRSSVALKQKKMPQHFNWTFLYEKTIQNRLTYLGYIDLTLNAKTVKTNKSRCTQCEKNEDDHLMETSRLVCNNTKCSHTCQVKFKVCHCFSTNNYNFFKLNEHENDVNMEVEINESQSSSSVALVNNPCRVGGESMTPKVKKLVKRLILENDAELANLVEHKILTKYKAKIMSYSNETMPSVIQIQKYLKDFRKQQQQQQQKKKDKQIVDHIENKNNRQVNESFKSDEIDSSKSNISEIACLNHDEFLVRYNWLAMQLYGNFIASAAPTTSSSSID